jgi:ketosteroid isomerase-like protein
MLFHLGRLYPLPLIKPEDLEVDVKTLWILLVHVISALALVGCQGSNNTTLLANQSLTQVDKAFSILSAQQGITAAFKQYAAGDALLLPENHAAIQGKAAIIQNLQGMPAGSLLTWSPQAADVSGDLGYSWGIYTLTDKDSAGRTTAAYGQYLSVWKRQAGGWRLAVMMINSTPGPAGG